MPQLLLDQFDTPGLWPAFDAANNPSGQIAVSADDHVHPFATEPNSLRVAIQPGASGHRLRRTVASTDLSDFDYLTLWHWSDVQSSGGSGDPLRLRLALGSAAMPIGSAGNDWIRYLTSAGASGWDYLAVALDDLPAAVRSALTTIEIQVVATDAAHVLILDGLEAQAPRMVADVDSALLGLLDGTFQLGGNPVPAVIAPDSPAGAAQPAIRLTPYKSVRSAARSQTGTRRTDFTDSGHRLRPVWEAWDLFYAVECDCASRSDQAQLADHVASTFGVEGWLNVGNRALRIDQVDAQYEAEDGPGDPYVLRYRIGAWADRGRAVPAVAVTEALLDADLMTGTGP